MPAVAPTRVVRIIGRLNVGGPAIQVISLTRGMRDRGYDTTLIRGREDPHEGSMDYLAEQLGVQPRLVSSLRRDPGWRDLVALARVALILARLRPQIVHTHAAKGGTIGRLAALLVSPRGRPLIIHTFHGHSLTGYFSARRARVFLAIERLLARRSDCLIAVSEEVRDELVALGVAGRERFEVVRLGFDLSRFAVDDEQRQQRRRRLREELAIAPGARVVTLIARLVPVKRVDRFLRMATGLADREDVHFLILGDGELRERLTSGSEARSLGARVTWAGFRRDIPDVCFASDVVVLCSDHEGTPVSLIEAQAAGTPVVSTRVGGVASVVRHGETGLVVEVDDETGLAQAVARLLDDPQLARRLGSAGAQHAATFSLEALVDRIDDLYRRLAIARPR